MVSNSLRIPRAITASAISWEIGIVPTRQPTPIVSRHKRRAMLNPSDIALVDSGIAVSVSSLSKSYRIYNRPRDRLLQSLWCGRRQMYREFPALDNVSFDVYRGE